MRHLIVVTPNRDTEHQANRVVRRVREINAGDSGVVMVSPRAQEDAIATTLARELRASAYAILDAHDAAYQTADGLLERLEAEGEGVDTQVAIVPREMFHALGDHYWDRERFDGTGNLKELVREHTTIMHYSLTGKVFHPL